MRKSRITISQPNEATESVRRQKKRTHRRWYTGRTEGGGGSAGKQAASENHLKLPQLNKITAGKQKVHQKDSGHSCNVFSFCLSPSPSPSISISLSISLFSLRHTLAYTHSPPTLEFPPTFLPPSLCLLLLPPTPPLFLVATLFLFFFFLGENWVPV